MRSFLSGCRRTLPVLAFTLLAVLPRPAGAITVTVTTDEKKVDGNCTLREAAQVGLEHFLNSSLSFPECTTGNGNALIEFKPGLGTITLTKALGTISLNFPVTVKGKQTISGGDKTQIFTIGSDPTVKLVDLVLEKGFFDGGGGAILVHGGSATLEITNCEFNFNNADFGGAIAFNGWKLKIDKSKFLANESNFGRGGAIWGGSNWTIADTEFDSNISLQGGGALNCESGGNLTIDRSVFFFNSATSVEKDPTCGGQPPPLGCAEGGGAIMSGCKATITDTLFDLNFAFGEVGGGALLLTDGGPKSKITTSVFRWNAVGFGEKNSGQGGAIFARGDVDILRCAIEQNFAKGSGGGIYFENSDSRVANTVVRANTAQLGEQQNPYGAPAQDSNGGAIAGVGSSHLEILNSSLVDNYGTSELFYFGTSYVYLKNSLIGTNWTDMNCDGIPPAQIVNGTNGFDGRNAQSPGIVATCEKVAPELVSTLLLPGAFPAVLPGGFTLDFQYPLGKFLTLTSGKGAKAVCKDDPVGGIDLLGQTRQETCTIGAVEGEAG